MKKFAVSALLALVCVIGAVCFIGCDNRGVNGGSGLTYGEKYGKDDNCYIFYKDGTGCHEYYYSYAYDNTVESYTIRFLWQVQSNNAIYLVFDKIEYNDNHTASKSANEDILTRLPIYYSEDMICYTFATGAPGTYTTTYKFIRQNSRLDLNND